MNTEDNPGESPSVNEAPEPSRIPIPRGALRLMAAVRWVLFALVATLAVYTMWTNWGPEGRGDLAREEARFYCPMHPQIRSPNPGECPICHMNLEPIPADRRVPAPGAQTSSTPLLAGPADVATVTISDEKQRAVGLMTSLVTTSALGDRLRVPAVISAPESGVAQVRVRAPGFVEQVNVRQTGVRVSRGQPLAFVYSPEIYRAQEEFITATRWSTAPGAGQPGASDIASAARRALELLGLSSADIDEVGHSGKPIRAIAVRAPASGYITRFNAVLGSRAEPEMVLYEIADLSSVWIIASVHERDLNGVRVGTTARFIVTGAKSEVLSSRIELIEPLLDEQTRTARVRLVVRNRDGHLRPGQFGEVEFELPATAGAVVPRDAVVRTGQQEYVYVAAASDRFEPRLVRTGLVRDGQALVLSGLAPGERVVTRGTFMLDSESRLQASLTAAPTAKPDSNWDSAEHGSSKQDPKSKSDP